MKHLTSILIVALLAVSCKKESTVSSDLIGNWVSTPSEWQLPIQNVTGDGEIVRFLETKESDGRKLTMFLEDSTYRFKVLKVSKTDMQLLYLRDNRALDFKKFARPVSGF